MEGFSVSEEIRCPIWQEQGLWKPWREMMKLRRQRLRNKWVGRKWKGCFMPPLRRGKRECGERAELWGCWSKKLAEGKLDPGATSYHCPEGQVSSSLTAPPSIGIFLFSKENLLQMFDE